MSTKNTMYSISLADGGTVHLYEDRSGIYREPGMYMHVFVPNRVDFIFKLDKYQEVEARDSVIIKLTQRVIDLLE